MPSSEPFRLTYSTMFDPPIELHQRFDAALAQVRTQLGAEQTMWIGGQARSAEVGFEVVSPIDRDWLLGRFPQGTPGDVADAVAAAQALPVGGHTLAGARAHPAARGRTHRGARLFHRRGAGTRGRQEPDEALGEAQETATWRW
jgi:1-pyrroline-5-carboxylate dehydrogenase